ncbi:MAG: hypothetical protein R3E85_07865 [Planctomycetota bacterium]
MPRFPGTFAFTIRIEGASQPPLSLDISRVIRVVEPAAGSPDRS